ncbi:MAG: lipase family protein [Pseudomonadota bacterium]|nr:lipase family protein [Pseudomonadota bacterium]
MSLNHTAVVTLLATMLCFGCADAGHPAPSADPKPGSSVPDTPQAELPPAPAHGWQHLPAGRIVQVLDAPATSQLAAAGQSLFVRYTTHNVFGDLALASGLVLLPAIPVEPAGQWPLVVYGHMTTGAADACAPTRGVPESSELRRMQQGDTLATALLNLGMVVARPDYEGLGEAGPHPYLRGDSLARAMRDMASAVADRWPEVGDYWVAAGHSEGGVAALNSGNRMHPPARGLELIGVVAITPVTQLEVLLTAAGDLPVAAPGVDVAVALAALALKGVAITDPAFEALLLEDGGLSEEAVALWPDIERLCLEDLSHEDSWGGLSPEAVKGPRGDEATAELIRAWQEDDVRLLPMRRNLPIRIDAGLFDAVALMPLTDALVKDYQDRGYDVTYARWPADHSPTADMAAPAIATWIMEQFAQ